MEELATKDLALRVVNVTKRFGNVCANDQVTFDVRTGAWHAIVGENGAGKSTILSIVYGAIRPDRGRISVNGQDVSRSLRSPADAIRLGIGLVTQHYSLVHGMTVLENMVLGHEPGRAGGAVIDWTASEARAAVYAAALGLETRLLRSSVESLSPAAQQKVEIAKALFRGADILLLDEPTATLAPHEAESLLAILHELNDGGATIVVVTHKLREVFDHSDSVTVLRSGKSAGTFQTSNIDRDRIFRLMIGEEFPPAADDGGGERQVVEVSSEREVAVRLSHLSVGRTRGSIPVRDADFAVRAGEIVGFAGVDGNGQTELAEAIVGLRAIATGTVEVEGLSVTSLSIRGRKLAGISYIPANRNRDGLIPSFSIEQNALLGHETDPDWGGGIVLRPRRLREVASDLISTWDVRGADRGGRTAVSSLSGGNQQKVLVGHALASRPKVLVACQPTRGLDIRSAQSVYARLRQEAANGMAVLLFSLDLDEVMDLSDRVIVMFDGALSPPIAKGDVSREVIGRLMTGLMPLTKESE